MWNGRLIGPPKINITSTRKNQINKVQMFSFSFTYKAAEEATVKRAKKWTIRSYDLWESSSGGGTSGGIT